MPADYEHDVLRALENALETALEAALRVRAPDPVRFLGLEMQATGTPRGVGLSS